MILKRLSTRVVCLIISLSLVSVYAGVVQEFIYNPNISGSILNVGHAEPALLPLVKTPFNGVTIPLPLSGTFELSNSQFTLYNPISFVVYRKNLGTLVSHQLNSSFDIKGLPPEGVSQVLSERLEGGADFTFDADYTYFQYAKKYHPMMNKSGFSVQLKSYSNASLHVPGDAFKLIFSNTEGLQKGNEISLSSLESEVSVISDLSLSYGRKTGHTIPFFQRLLDFSWGVTGAYKMGHMMFHLETDDALISYSEDNVMSIQSDFKVTSAGVKLNDQLQFVPTFRDEGFINGHGAAFSGGVALSGENVLFSLSVNDLGFMAWNSDMNNQNISFSEDSLYLVDLQGGATSNVTLEQSREREVSVLECSLSFKVSLYQELKRVHNTMLRNISYARAVSLGILQPFTEDYLGNRTPHFFISLENETFKGTVPVRVGWEYQNEHNHSSFLELEQVAKSLTVSFWYRARNDLLFRPTKGGEIGISSHVYW